MTSAQQYPKFADKLGIDFADRGGRGVQKSHNFVDVIYESSPTTPMCYWHVSAMRVQYNSPFTKMWQCPRKINFLSFVAKVAGREGEEGRGYNCSAFLLPYQSSLL